MGRKWGAQGLIAQGPGPRPSGGHILFITSSSDSWGWKSENIFSSIDQDFWLSFIKNENKRLKTVVFFGHLLVISSLTNWTLLELPWERGRIAFGQGVGEQFLSLVCIHLSLLLLGNEVINLNEETGEIRNIKCFSLSSFSEQPWFWWCPWVLFFSPEVTSFLSFWSHTLSLIGQLVPYSFFQ